jgi:hypothetical protein
MSGWRTFPIDSANVQARGLAGCRTAVEDGTVPAYAGPDVTDDLAW